MDRYTAIAQLRLIRCSEQASLRSYDRNTRGLRAAQRNRAVADIKARIEALDYAIAELDLLPKTLAQLQRGTVN